MKYILLAALFFVSCKEKTTTAPKKTIEVENTRIQRIVDQEMGVICYYVPEAYGQIAFSCVFINH